jgi:rhamnulokinase
MPESQRFLTFDLGAESGRSVLGSIADGKLSLDEVHRFPNEPQLVLGRFHWDTLRLFGEIKSGLTKCVKNHTAQLDGIGLDTWGVDFALLDKNDELLGQPYHYRDHRTDGVMQTTFGIVSKEEIYRSTGIQFMQLNTLFQLMSLRLSDSPLLDSADKLLMTPDLLNFWLTGNRVNEFSIATTTQCYDPVNGNWAVDMLQRLGLPSHLFGQISPSGTKVGPLHSSVMQDSGAGPITVIAPATHDTGSAVASVPAEGKKGWAYVSCGTWSLVGVETDQPYINDRTLAYNLTNEGGVNCSIRLLRNVMGLWLLQQCRRVWEKEGSTYTYEQLAVFASEAPPFAAVLDPDDDGFLNPPDMPAAISEFCKRTGQDSPNGTASIVRTIIESLALKYRWVIERLEDVTGEQIATIHIIGGGSQNKQLCQAAADATGRRVLAGPVEATAAGNIIVQALSVGAISSISEGRALIRRSFPLVEYLPANAGAWESPYRKLEELVH